MSRNWKEYDNKVIGDLQYNTVNKPKQKISYNDKIKDDGKWWKQTIAYYVRQSNNQDKNEIILLKKAAQGQIDESHYSYILKSPDGKERKYPAQIRNYDILSEIVNTYVGERADHPNTTQVVVKGNNEGMNMVDIQFQEYVLGRMEQDVVNKLNDLGKDTGVDSTEPINFQQERKAFYATAKDIRAMEGQDVLDFIHAEQDVMDKRQDMLRDWVTCDKFVSFKEVYSDDVNYEYVPAEELTVFPGGKSRFIEDAPAVVRHNRWNINEVIDRFRDDLEAITTSDFDPIDYLEQKYNYREEPQGLYSLTTKEDFNRAQSYVGFEGDTNLIDVYHVNYNSQKKIGILDYNSLLGMELQIEVPEDYKFNIENGDISIKWIWVNQTWQGYQISDNLFLAGAPLETQRADITNSSEHKLQYNGIVKKTVNNKIYSSIKRALPKQIIYNIVHFQLEKTINKNKDKILFVPQGLVPRKGGQNEFDLMYNADSTGIVFVDETSDSARANMDNVKVLDAGLIQYIKGYHDILKELRNDVRETEGFNRQRLGQMNSSDGKGTTENAIARSAVLTRETFRKFDKFEEKDDQGLLDLSRVAYSSGKKANYVTSDGYEKMIDIDGAEYQGTNFGVFAKDRFAEYEKLEQIKQYGFAFAQNDNDPEALVEMVDSNNIASMKAILKRAKEEKRKFEDYLKKQEIESNEGIAASAKETKDAEIAQKDAHNKDDNDTKIEIANIKANSDLASANAISKNKLTEDDIDLLDDAEDRLGERGQNFTERKHEDDKLEKEKERQNKLKIAKENKNQYDRKS